MLDTLPPSVSEWGIKREQENEGEKGKAWFEGEEKGRKLRKKPGENEKKWEEDVLRLCSLKNKSKLNTTAKSCNQPVDYMIGI